MDTRLGHARPGRRTGFEGVRRAIRAAALRVALGPRSLLSGGAGPVRASFVHGIRFRLVMAALVLLALPWLAVQFISRMEAGLREAEETAIWAHGATVT